MSDFRLLVKLGRTGPVNSISINLRNRSEAFLVAQNYDAPSELWEGDERLCTISRAGDGGLWLISKGGAD